MQPARWPCTGSAIEHTTPLGAAPLPMSPAAGAAARMPGPGLRSPPGDPGQTLPAARDGRACKHVTHSVTRPAYCWTRSTRGDVTATHSVSTAPALRTPANRHQDAGQNLERARSKSLSGQRMSVSRILAFTPTTVTRCSTGTDRPVSPAAPAQNVG